MTRILWLASWYPNARDEFEGDFIQRHAQAVSEKVPIELIFVGKNKLHKSNQECTETSKSEVFINLFPKIIYYPENNPKIHFIKRIQSFIRYFNSWRKEINTKIKQDQLPNLIHVHVALRAGIVALYLKRRYGIPYVLTEHWSGYYKGPSYSLFEKSFFERQITIRVLKNASLILPVSRSLGEQINQHWTKIKYKQIPNVVDTRFFHYQKNTESGTFRFIHISTLKYPKNPEAIVRAFGSLRRLGFNADLVIIGTINESVKNCVDSVPDNSHIIMNGQLSYQEVAVELKKSNALVMFSSFENQPCVILESLCCGVPVIATNVGGIPEVINSENGILIENGHEEQLLNAMKEMIDNYGRFDRSEISRKAELQFSYENVSTQIINVYNQILQ